MTAHAAAGHDDVIKWKYFPRYRPFVRGIHRSPVNSPHKSQWRGALFFICAWRYGWVNNRKAGDLRRHRAQYHVTVMVGSCRWVTAFYFVSNTIVIMKSYTETASEKVVSSALLWLTAHTQMTSRQHMGLHVEILSGVSGLKWQGCRLSKFTERLT